MRKIIIALTLVIALLLSACGSDATCKSHRDKDGNGICDKCNTSVVEVVDFYAINDLHGKLLDGADHPGVDELTTYLSEMTAADDAAVLLSSGDMWQGAPESNLTGGLMMTDWMNDVGFAAMTLGNHEYDWGHNAILENAEAAEFPLLAINVYDRATNEQAEYCQSSVMVERGNVKIGIIGAIGDCYSSISPDKVEDVYFKVGRELTELVKDEAMMLRALGADVIVYSLHDGYDDSKTGGVITESNLRGYYDLALSDGYVDLVFEGHTHQSYALMDAHGVYHLQGGGDNDGITHAELEINYVTGDVSVNRAEYVSSRTYEGFADDDIIDELEEKYSAEMGIANRVLGTTLVTRGSDELRELIARLYCEAAVEKWGAEYDVFLGGGYLSARAPYKLLPGEITYGELVAIFPFDNELVLCSVRGSDLKSRFLYTTNSTYYIALSDFGEANLGAIDDAATYYIVVDSYSASYAPNRLTPVAYYGENIYARDLLAKYIEDGGFN